jgi:hypothetical protein
MAIMTQIGNSAIATPAARVRRRVGGTVDLNMSDDLLALTC